MHLTNYAINKYSRNFVDAALSSSDYSESEDELDAYSRYG